MATTELLRTAPRTRVQEDAKGGETRAATRGGEPRAKYPGKWNNPGNLRPGADGYVGQNGTKKVKGGKFLTFDTPQNGLNAMANAVAQIRRVKIPAAAKAGRIADSRFTAENLVSIYAPKSDGNDTTGYADFLSKRLGVLATDELKYDDKGQMAKLLDALVRRDSGHEHADWFTPEEYEFAAGLMAWNPEDTRRGAETRQDAKGGDSVRADEEGGEAVQEEAPQEEAPQEEAPQEEAPQEEAPQEGGPRIIINPEVFRDKRDAKCVAWNEAFRVLMEEMGFDPVGEPTDAQRRFFADTAYSNDETMLRRTILARICTFDTSISDSTSRPRAVQQDAEEGDASPAAEKSQDYTAHEESTAATEEQIQEAIEFLEMVMKSGAPQNSEEQSVVQRAHDALGNSISGRGRQESPDQQGEHRQGGPEQPSQEPVDDLH